MTWPAIVPERRISPERCARNEAELDRLESERIKDQKIVRELRAEQDRQLQNLRAEQDRQSRHLEAIRANQIQHGQVLGQIQAHTHAMSFVDRTDDSKVFEIAKLGTERATLEHELRDARAKLEEKKASTVRRINWFLTIGSGVVLWAIVQILSRFVH